MKNYKIWYLGYLLAAIFGAMSFLPNLNPFLKIVFILLMSSSFAIAFVEINHQRMLMNDKDYEVELKDERSMMLRDKTNSMMSIYYCSAIGVVGVVSMVLENYIPGIITWIIILLAPFISHFAYKYYEKKY